MSAKHLIRTSILIALATVCLFFVLPKVVRQSRNLSRVPLKANPAIPAVVRAIRPNYPFSIVPGGLYSRSELTGWLARDPVVARHYDGFGAQEARFVATGQDAFAYVSYRRGDLVFWTRRRLRIPKGELLLTDGTHFARARCGNRVNPELPPGARIETNYPPELELPPFSMPLFRAGAIGSYTPPEAIPELPLLAKTIPMFPVPVPVSTETAPDMVPPGQILLPPAPLPVPPSGAPSSTGTTGTSGTTGTTGTTGSTGTVPVVPTPVPEPEILTGAGAIVLLSLLALPAVRRLRRK